ncbi:hypothetical protein GURKE_04940 [Brevundimonas phage vB_BpoS-Gurke]|uniref:Uncharacterized protein n=1 Tax=Brevundimonas phage vB_BpoS-Gurke TaxID=2948599 RepID=A0A9E7N264_9CAUD|nr:hypothetical protein GURKE_04940 [Brevundimonas phage vB_BpoS-Gurke]
MTTKLIEFRAPTVEELAEGVGKGADIVFIRRDRQGDDLRVFASYYEGSYQQWGQGVHVLGDNVEAVTAWANGLREVESLIDDREEEEESLTYAEKVEIARDAGYTVNRKTVGVHVFYVFNDPDGNDDDSADCEYPSAEKAWVAAYEDSLTYCG